MSTSKLSSLKSQLTQLRNARDGVRLATALTSSFFWLAGTLVVWFVLDYSLNLSPLHRGLVMAASMPVLVYGISQAFSAMKGWGASLIDTAISVEHRHGIDGDLVAAIQFEQGQAVGSAELRSAVVDYVAELKNEINIFEGFDSKPTRNRFLGVGLIVVLAIGFCFLAPRHVSAFFQRLAFYHVNYPTKTQITSIQINGQPVDLSNPSQPVTVGYGSALELQIACDGVVPKNCRVALRDEKGEQTEAQLPQDADADSQFTYALDRLIQPIQYQVFAGDTQTPELSIEIIPLPALKVELAATPPDYAKGIQLSAGNSSTHMAVLAGSNVSLKAIADRELNPPSLILRHGAEEATYSLSADTKQNNTWQLDTSSGPLNNVQETIAYELTAIDQHGLQSASPIRGTIRVVPDRVPNASLQTIHHIVLPTASPVLRYRATDDFGLADLVLRLDIRRPGSASRVVEVPMKSFADAEPAQTSVEGEYALAFSQAALEVGDLVQVTLQVTDFRGGAGEMIGMSDPVHLEIGDESTVLAAIAEADKQSEQMLSELIQQQLGLGESR
ncbi:hypothetical protein AB1L30_23805 [Bremerella sp. JC817]|uniref:hypothetical protein n=1 Tax=Bremerella sp. JC817 TaxID=3231756 RepID=UPI003459E775